MYRELARAREISKVTQTGALTLGETGKAIKKAYQIHHIQPESQHQEKIHHFQIFLLEYLPIIKLTSVSLGWWNFFQFLVIYYTFIVNIFSIFILFVLDHEQGSNMPYHIAANYSLGFVLLVDMLFIRWRCDYVGVADTQRTHELIAQRYFKYYFVLDLMVLAITILDHANVKISYWKLIIYLKIFSFQQIKEEIYAVINGYKTEVEVMFEFLRMLLFIVFWSFFFGSVFVTIELQIKHLNDYYYQNNFSWMLASPALDFINLYEAFDWYVWFQYGLFMVLQMVRGAGMGVPAPQSPVSSLWYCIANLNMTAMFWYFTSKVIELLGRLHEKKSEQESNMLNLIDIRDRFQLPKKSYQKYRSGVEVSVSSRLKSKHLENKMSTMFSSTLWKEFNYGMKQHFLLRFQFLRHIVTHSFSEELFRIELSQIIKSKIVYQNEVLYTCNKRSVQRLYLSEDSELIVFNEDLNYIQELPEWSFAGVREFFVDSRPHFDVIASEFSLIQYIQKDEFEAVVRMYPMVHESYCELRDEMLIERTGTENIQLPCYHCGEYHLSEDCHRIAIDKITLLNKYHLHRQNSSNHEIHLHNYEIMSEDIPFFRSMTSSSKIRRLTRNRIQIDKYKFRGFNYLNYNIQKVEYHRRAPKRPIIQSQMFKISNHSINIRSSKHMFPSDDSLSIIPINS